MIVTTLLSTLAPATATLPLAGGMDDDISVWRVAAALLLCLGLAVAGAFILRARQGGRVLSFAPRERRLQIVDSIRLGRQADLCIVRCDSHEWLIAVSPNGVSLIGTPDAAGKPESRIAAP